MKKLFSAAVCAAMIGWTGNAMAIPFQIGANSSLDFSALALASYSYTSPAAGPFLLDEGKSTGPLNLFKINFSGVAAGYVSATIDLVSPTGDFTLNDTGFFVAADIFLGQYADVKWGAPIELGYSYGGNTGGILSLDLADIHITSFGKGTKSINITGSITNVKDALAPVQEPGTAPIPEPGTMLLFGTGLIGLAAVGRRKRITMD